jgi:hypothetical protein
MFADFWLYVRLVVGNWLEGYWFLTALPEALSYFMPPQSFQKLAHWLDAQATQETRRKFYAAIAIAGLVFASFSAWDEQYQRATSKSPSALQSEVNQLKAHQWPVLSDGKKEALISALRSAGHNTLTISCNDDDCEDLADDIKDAAQKADWNPTIVSGALHGMQSGLWFCGPIDQKETRDRLAKALEDATGAHVDTDLLDKGYFIAIGRRPRS